MKEHEDVPPTLKDAPGTLGDISWDEQGLAPAIVQDAATGKVLMLAYMNATSLRRTLRSGETWFWSRSRQELWHKGQTSGHTQRVERIHYDCDADALLLEVRPSGPACHTGARSCFYRELPLPPDVAATTEDSERPPASSSASEPGGLRPPTSPGIRGDILAALERVIAQRDEERPSGAYTTYLFEQGLDKILKKVGEESSEVVIAAKNQDNEELKNEVGDLLYHLMVLLREAGLPIADVLGELDRRRDA